MVNIYTSVNSLNTAKSKYCFRSTIDQTLDTEQLIQEIVRYHSSFTEADARAILSVLDDKVTQYVNMGYKVELPFGYVFLKANGTVNGINDGFLPGTANHRITANFTFKENSAESMIKGAVYRMAGSGYTILPVIKDINSLTDEGKESTELNFHAGAIVRIKGNHLSFDLTDSVQGVFLVNDSKNEIRCSKYHNIGTNIIDAYVPAGTAAGSYEIKIVTKPGSERYEKYLYSTIVSID